MKRIGSLKCYRVLWCLLLSVFHIQIFAASAPKEVRLQQTTYMGLPDVANKIGMQFRWISTNKIGELYNRTTRVRFQLHKRDFLFNEKKVYLGNPVTLYRGKLYVSKIDLGKTVMPLLAPGMIAKPPKLYRIVIDPGHGGKDPGAMNKRYGLKEKTLTLQVSAELRRRLEAYGYKVVMTRTTDKFIPLAERASIANKAQADLMVSIHFNAVAQTSVEGYETYICTPAMQPSTSRTTLHSSDRNSYPGNINDNWNLIAGYNIHSELVKGLKGKDRGLKRARFRVLRDIKCPGILLEMGFVSNPKTARNLKTSSHIREMADVLAKGILRYQKTLNKVRGK